MGNKIHSNKVVDTKLRVETSLHETSAQHTRSGPSVSPPRVGCPVYQQADDISNYQGGCPVYRKTSTASSFDESLLVSPNNNSVNVAILSTVTLTNKNKNMNKMGLPIVALDYSGIIVNFNHAAEEMFGYTKEEAVGKNVNILMPENIAKQHDKLIARYLKSGKSVHIGKKRTLFAMRKNGEEFPIEIEISDAKEQSLFIGYIRETTMEHKLQGSQNMVNALVNISTIPVIGMDEDRIIRIISNSALEVFGYQRDELLGKNVKILMESKIAQHHDEYVQHYIKTGEKKVVDAIRQINGLRKNGELFPIELKVTEIINSADSSKYFIGYLRDMSAMVTSKEQDNRAKLADEMFPPSISLRLTNKEEIHDSHSMVSVLFADIVGFTSISDKLSAEKLVTLLDDMFHTFDGQLLEKFKLEKVKTIGDCYMIASGIPYEHLDHANNIVQAALLMIDLVKSLNKKHAHYLSSELRVRIGVNSGPVVAGIVGLKKPVYDVFGDSVNVASRMESTGTPMQIHISPTTFRALRTDLQSLFYPRGTVEVKGKGQMETYITQL
jgi:PAS domain S-box-containing protein